MGESSIDGGSCYVEFRDGKDMLCFVAVQFLIDDFHAQHGH